MNKEVEKIYKRKIKEFQKHNKLYYDKSTPVISDREFDELKACLLYTSPSPRDATLSRMPSSA